MKKITSIIIFLLCVSQGFAQNNGANKSSSNLSSVEKAAKDIANDMCDCFNTLVDSVHPIFKQYFEKLAQEGVEVAEEWMKKEMQKLSLEEQERIENDTDKIDDYLDENCGEDLEDKYKNHIQDKNFKELVMKYISSKANCKLTQLMIQYQ